MKIFLGNQNEAKIEELSNNKTTEQFFIENTNIQNVKDNKQPIMLKRSFLYEDVKKRDSNGKHYIGNNGTVTAVYGRKAVHYLDPISNALRDVDNGLVDIGEVLETKANSFKTQFRKNVEKGKILDIIKGNCKIELISRDLAEKGEYNVASCFCEDTNCTQSKVAFKNIKNNVDLQYIVDSDRVKENIIINKQDTNYKYNFDLNIENLDIGVSEDGKTLLLKDKVSGEVKFYIPAPFMMDAVGAHSDLVYYELDKQSDTKYSLEVVADSGWINDKERKFPVTIDPEFAEYDSSIMTYKFEQLVEKEHSSGLIQSWESIDTSGLSSVSLNSNKRLTITLDKRNVLFSGKVVTAKLRVYTDSSGAFYYKNELYTFISNWVDLDITQKLKDTSNSFQLVLTSDSATSISLNNILIVEYAENERELETKEFSLSGGVLGKLDIASGEFVTSFADVNAGDSLLSLPITHIHKKSDTNYGCGNDWRLNLHQKLIKSGNDYFYTDSNGRVHTFEDTYYYIESGIRKSVEKNNVVVDQNGVLTTSLEGKTYEVIRELSTKNGARIVTRLEGLININYLDQRQDDEKQLEEYIESYKKSLDDLYLVTKDDLTQCAQLDYSSAKKVEGFISSSKVEGRAIITYSEYLQIRSLRISNASENTSDTLKSFNLEQIDKIWSSTEERFNQVQKLYTEYLSKTEQLKNLKKQLPTAYLIGEDGTIIYFNESGNLCAVTDNYENYIAIEWGDIVTATGIKERITAVYAGERKTSLEYNYSGQLVAITDYNGARVEYNYTSTEEDGTLNLVTFSDGSMIRFGYDSNGEINFVRSTDQTLTKLGYDINGYSLKKITNLSTVSTLTDTSTPVTKATLLGSTSVSGNTVSDITLAYDTNYLSITDNDAIEYILLDDNKKLRGNYVKKNGKIDEVNFYASAERSHSFSLKLKKTVDIVGSSSTVDTEIVNCLGNPLPTISSLPGMTTEYSTFAEADWESVTLDDFNRAVSSKTNWRRIGTTASGSAVYAYAETAYTYDATDPSYPCLKKTTTTYINKLGTKGTTNAEKTVSVETYAYNDFGKLCRKESWIEGEEGTSGVSVTETEYDEKGNAVREISYNTLDSSTKFYKESEVAENGQVIADIDETGENKTVYNYTKNGKTVLSQTLPSGSKFGYGYDESGNVTAITQSTADGEENSSNVKYTLNFPTRLTSGNNVVYYEYDKKRRKSKVTVNGTVTAYAYDDDLNKTETTFAGHTFASYTDGSGNVIKTEIDGQAQVEYTYENSKLTSVADKITNATLTYEYATDKTGKVINVSGGSLTEAYGYNEYGQLGNKAITGAVNQAYAYNYKANAAKEIDYITLPNTLKCYPQTDVNGRNKGKELLNGETKVYGEYISYRKVGDHATNMPSAVYYGQLNNGKYAIAENLKYKYDSCGNIAEVFENGTLSIKYSYDSIGRLIREDNKKLGKTYLFSYDSCGNILSKRTTAYTVKPEEEIATAFEENTYAYAENSDKLLSFNGNAITYDSFGNPTNYKGNALTWQYGKRLVKYGDTTFSYDGYGRRLTKGNITFTYDNEGNLVKQSNGLEFIYDHSGLNGFKYNGTNYIYRKNAQGDITHILNATTGEVVAQYTYDAWGNYAVVKDTNGIAELNPFRYRGYYYDTETDLYFLQTRYYDPEVGRFISQDDVSYLDPETINGLNLYAYCGNNPVMRVDPNGNAWWHWVLGGVIIIGLAVATIFTAGAAGVGVGAAFAAGFTGSSIIAGVGGSALAATACTIVSSAFAGAIVTAGLGLITGGLQYKSGMISWDWDAASEGFGLGALFGAASGALLANPVMNFIGKRVGSLGKHILHTVLSSAISGSFTILQGLASGGINWDDVILSFSFGGFGGALGGRFFKSGIAKVLQTIFTSVGLSIIESGFSELIEWLRSSTKSKSYQS